jgi:hypothetical protein
METVMKGSIMTLLIALLLVSCKSRETAIKAASFRTETEISTRDASTALDSLRALSEQVFKMLLKENLNIVVRQIFYDTNHPSDSGTHRPPVVEERETAIMRQTQINTVDSLLKDKFAVRQTATDVQALTITKASGKTHEKTANGLKGWQKALMAIGGTVIIGFVVFIIIKIKK